MAKRKISGERFLPGGYDREMEIEHMQRYLLAKQFAGGKDVLDAACGEGYGSKILLEAARSVVGIDVDEETVKEAAAKYTVSSLRFVCGNIEHLPFEDDCFDMVVSFETIEHIDGQAQEHFLKEIKRVLRTDGCLLISTPNKRVYTEQVKADNPFHVKEFYVQEYLEFLKHYFPNIECFSQYPNTGYFISKECGSLTVQIQGAALKECRYVIALCSERQIKSMASMEDLAQFDNQMYYFLSRRSHELEQEILKIKTESEQFEEQLETEIVKQKEYIGHLEADVEEQKKYVEHLERDIKTQQEYAEHLERDIKTQQEYIDHLKADIAELNQYIDQKKPQFSDV